MIASVLARLSSCYANESFLSTENSRYKKIWWCRVLLPSLERTECRSPIMPDDHVYFIGFMYYLVFILEIEWQLDQYLCFHRPPKTQPCPAPAGITHQKTCDVLLRHQTLFDNMAITPVPQQQVWRAVIGSSRSSRVVLSYCPCSVIMLFAHA